MINLTLLKQSIKSNAVYTAAFAIILTIYICVMITMFDPNLGALLNQFAEQMPDIMSLFGMQSAGTTLVSFLSNYLYGFFMIIFPMIATIVIANRLISRHVDKGSMTYLLAAPVTRNTVVFTQMLVLNLSILITIVYSTVLGIVISSIAFPGELDISTFITLNFGVYLMHFLIGGICFFASCISNETRQCLLIGAGIPIISYIIQMLANMGGKLEWLNHLTFFSLFDPSSIVNGDSYIIQFIVMILAGIILNISGAYVFNKKNLPL